MLFLLNLTLQLFTLCMGSEGTITSKNATDKSVGFICQNKYHSGFFSLCEVLHLYFNVTSVVIAPLNSNTVDG